MDDPKAIITNYLDDELTEGQDRELLAWIRQAPENRKQFVVECYLHSQLKDIFAGERIAHDATVSQTCGSEEVFVPCPVLSEPSTDRPTLGSPPFLGIAIRGAVGYFSTGWPLAYLVATVVLGIGILIGSIIPASRPQQIARQSVPLPSPLSPLSSTVGRITGMVDCRWVDRKTAPVGYGAVPLGGKYALVSGLMEITYDTGAKVILQGPVTYEVESKDGGYLSVGKLAARVESAKPQTVQPKPQAPSPKSDGIHPSSFIPHPLFAVRTPTAIVTDLGTEFGVEVDQSGVTESHVFAGKVKVLALADRNGLAGHEVTLGENESVRVEKQQGNSVLKMVRGTVDPAAFVRVEQLSRLAREHVLKPRRRWKTYSEQLRKDPALVAYYTFESAGRSNAVLPNLSSAGSALDGQVDGAEWVHGRFPGKYALYFHGPGSGDKVVLPEHKLFRFTGPFSVAAWFRVERFTAMSHTLVTKGVTSWQLQQDKRTRQISFDTSRDPFVDPFWDVTRAPTKVDDGRWHLAVSVFDPVGNTAIRKVYIDGRLEVTAESPAHFRQNEEPVWLGANSELPGAEFYGPIDEAAIFSRTLSAGEVAAMFEAGSPDGMVIGKPEAKKQKGGARH